MTRIGAKDELFGAHTLRTMGHAPYGGADIGECLATLARVQGTDLSSWYGEWTLTANRVQALAEAEETAGHVESARLAYWRASNYFRNAGTMLLGAPLDRRAVEANLRQTDAFRRGAQLMPSPPRQVEIPCGDTTLPGYLFRSEGPAGDRPMLIALGGYDGTAEENYFFNGAAALARGYDVLTFDGPGQGAALLQRGMVMRPDYENVITPVVDFVLQQTGVDPNRIALVGLSLGGYLAPRAASGEHRLAACIADGGQYDLFDAVLQRMPAPVARGFAEGRSSSAAMLRRVLRGMERRPTAGWSLRRGQLVHGAADSVTYLDMLRDYTLKGRAGRITCPTLVCHAESDPLGAQAPELYDALTGRKELITFTVAEGAGDHCEAGARTLFHARAFGWLDSILRPAQVLSGSGY
ncbi:alpha/beta fold hydrolase [Asanoa sp. WMMD1127]|uniref:alpha/beta hydrolase family protein n=1 Tax=Asanoa sp. WMMD1127 TaxID=3016107 RepID=UPI002416295F|nr:alpha/beta fold hydrolase [Asanoa sp. WMMD1127]MDG4820472.1 alpha/beta fold hydrolase [Asanoa sp. WMMD1127]